MRERTVTVMTDCRLIYIEVRVYTKIMDFTLNVMDFTLNMVGFVFKMMSCAAESDGGAEGSLPGACAAAEVVRESRQADQQERAALQGGRGWQAY